MARARLCGRVLARAAPAVRAAVLRHLLPRTVPGLHARRPGIARSSSGLVQNSGLADATCPVH
eukprot:1893835-Heterocapsa_arctica.AAC.1